MGKRVEDVLVVLLRKGDARVANGELQQDSLHAVLHPLNLQRYFSLLGEFYGVGYQVGDNLPKPRGISMDHLRDSGENLTSQLQLFPPRKALENGFQDVSQTEIACIQLQPSRFYFGEV